MPKRKNLVKDGYIPNKAIIHPLIKMNMTKVNNSIKRPAAVLGQEKKRRTLISEFIQAIFTDTFSNIINPKSR